MSIEREEYKMASDASYIDEANSSDTSDDDLEWNLSMTNDPNVSLSAKRLNANYNSVRAQSDSAPHVTKSNKKKKYLLKN